MYLNAWSSAGALVEEPLPGGALLKEAHHWGELGGFAASPYFLLALSASRVAGM